MERYTIFINREQKKISTLRCRFFTNWSIYSPPSESKPKENLWKLTSWLQKCKGSKLTKITLKKKKNVGWLTLSDLRTHNKASVKAEIMWDQCKDRQTDKGISAEPRTGPTYTDNWFSTKLPRWFSGERITF